MNTSLKAGSIIRIPIFNGWKVTSSNPAICNATVANGVATITALSPGQAALILQPAADVGISLAVTVTA